MSNRAKRNGSPAPVTPRKLKSVELRGGDRLKMENLLLERDLFAERTTNLEFRRKELDREAAELAALSDTNKRIRDEFISARGLDITRPVSYGDGTLSET